MIANIKLRILCPFCGSPEIETNPAKDNEKLAPGEVDELDKYRCRDCKKTFTNAIKKWE